LLHALARGAEALAEGPEGLAPLALRHTTVTGVIRPGKLTPCRLEELTPSG
jgi:hypothetical protein